MCSREENVWFPRLRQTCRALVLVFPSTLTTMIRFILVQVSGYRLTYVCCYDVAQRTGKVKQGYPSGMFLTTTTRRSASRYHPQGYWLTQTLQVRLRGEVHRLVAPRDQKYQSNFVEVCHPLLNSCMCSCWYLVNTVPQLQSCIPTLCGAILLCLCWCKRQRTGLLGSDTFVRWGPRCVPTSSPETRLWNGSDSFFDNVCELDLVFNFYKVSWMS